MIIINLEIKEKMKLKCSFNLILFKVKKRTHLDRGKKKKRKDEKKEEKPTNFGTSELKIKASLSTRTSGTDHNVFNFQIHTFKIA